MRGFVGSCLREFSFVIGVFATLFLAGCESGELNNPNQLKSGSNSLVSAESRGFWDLGLPFPGEGSYSGVTGLPQASQLCSGLSLVGVDGAAICLDADTPTSDAALAPRLLAGAVLYDDAGKRVIGTMATGANVIGANAELSVAIPEGYYDGAKTCSMSDTNLLASNIVQGVTIFGIPGSAALSPGACSGGNQTDCVASATFPTQSTPAEPAGAANVLSGKQFYAGGALQTGSMEDRGNWNMNTATWPGPGYYSGVTLTLTTANVCSGTQIFGAAGAAVCQSGTTSAPAGAANILADFDAWDVTGAKITGSMSNRGVLDAAVAFPGSGFYSGTVDNLPNAANVCTGTMVLGVEGSANCAGAGPVYDSNAHRDQGTARITQTEETTTYAGADLPPQYREVPKISKDDDGGFSSPNITKVNRLGFTDCGTFQATIELRIADCADRIGAEATWDGTLRGNAGQGLWKLVARSSSNEVWRDERTGLLWSSLISTSINWCRASGSSNASGVAAAYREDDPSDYCDNPTYQDQTTPESACFEADGFASTYVDAAGKVGLKAASSPSVRWRLPTIYDYHIAEVNGLRFVIYPDGAFNDSEWSATLWSGNRGYAWVFDRDSGGRSTSRRDMASATVRCVGR